MRSVELLATWFEAALCYPALTRNVSLPLDDEAILTLVSTEREASLNLQPFKKTHKVKVSSDLSKIGTAPTVPRQRRKPRRKPRPGGVFNGRTSHH